MTDQYIQDPLFYTEEEVQAKITEATTNLYTQDALYQFRDRGIKTYLERMQGDIQTVLRATDLVDRETAVALYNEIADYYGWEHMTALNTYTVEVTYGGNLIGTFSVEAEDEDAAIEEVQSNMEAEGTMTISLSYNDQEVSGEAYLYNSDLCESFEYRAWEE